MSRALNWEAAKARELGRRGERLRPVGGRPGKGITNQQASYLAHLQRQAGLPYTGSGMTCRQATEAIRRLLAGREQK